jgi:hypothetical protein
LSTHAQRHHRSTMARSRHCVSSRSRIALSSGAPALFRAAHQFAGVIRSEAKDLNRMFLNQFNRPETFNL